MTANIIDEWRVVFEVLSEISIRHDYPPLLSLYLRAEGELVKVTRPGLAALLRVEPRPAPGETDAQFEYRFERWIERCLDTVRAATVEVTSVFLGRAMVAEATPSAG